MPGNYVVQPLLLMIIVVLSACSSAGTPNPPAPATNAAETPTPLATVSVLTPTPAQEQAAAPAPQGATPTSPSVTPTRPPATPTPQPSPTPVVYVVEEFDTLLGIALENDTTVAALAAANGINQNDFLQIGQELIIPTAAQATAVAANESTPAQSEATAPPPSNATQAFAGNAAAQPPAAEVAPAADSTGQPVQPDSSAAQQPAAAPAAPAPKTSRPANINPLTGLPVDDPAKLQRRPVLVRIGNDVGARASQAGLNSADIVYEEITEWWVTRFTAIFLAEAPNTVAPVRSARLINVQLVPQYQGALAHSGGSDPVRWEISQAPIVNLDEFYHPLPYYYRPNQGWQTRLAIDVEAARDYMVSQGTEAAVSLHGFVFSNTIAKGEPAENIFIPYPRATTFTQWRYTPSTGKYLRWADTQPLMDANGLGQVAASNVIVYFAEHQETDIVEDSNGATSIRIMMNGQGPAWFFRDGKLNKGFWQTDGSRTPYFSYADGSPYRLKPGNTWIEVVPTYFTIGLNSPDEASASP